MTFSCSSGRLARQNRMEHMALSRNNAGLFPATSVEVMGLEHDQWGPLLRLVQPSANCHQVKTGTCQPVWPSRGRTTSASLGEYLGAAPYRD
jgi:hypothetical protein